MFWIESKWPRLPRRHKVVPKTSDSIAWTAVALSTVSSIGNSTNWPDPVRSAKFSAASTANAACTPASGSQAPRGVTGGPSGSPVTQARPAICSMVGANPTRSRQGPSKPNAGIRAKTSSGLTFNSASAVSPNCSITRGEKFSITTSAPAPSSVNRRRPSSEPKSSVTERLLVFMAWNTQPYSHQSSTSVRIPPEYRMPSGRWMDSTLTTSAPNAASRWVAAGPAQKAVRSTMRTPANGSSCDADGSSNSSWRQGGSASASPTASVSDNGAGAHADISHGGGGGGKP